MDDRASLPDFFLSNADEASGLQPLYSNFVGVHEGDDEIALVFCIREVNSMDVGGKVVGIHPHTRIFLPPTAAYRLYLALKSHFAEQEL